MSSRLRQLACAALFLGGASCAGAAAAPAPSATVSPNDDRRGGAESITVADFRARVEYLASDALRGRDTPSPGLEAAATYLSEEYRRLGLQPGGAPGSFHQRWPYRDRQGTVHMVPNIVAILPGADPELRDEYVVLSAHMDHVGVGRPVAGDSIYNGADDNASGTAALVEVAEAFASVPQRPRRSVIFLHVSGEEHGLLGSKWYSENPTVPLERIVANINVDMIARNSPDSVVVIGKKYSSLGETANAIQRRHPELRLTLSDDLWPEERFFYRSDHYNFARKEIPALFFFSGVHPDYHRPSDEVEKLDLDKAARITRMIYHLTEEIANTPGRPTWDPAGLAEVRSMTR